MPRGMGGACLRIYRYIVGEEHGGDGYVSGADWSPTVAFVFILFFNLKGGDELTILTPDEVTVS